MILTESPIYSRIQDSVTEVCRLGVFDLRFEAIGSCCHLTFGATEDPARDFAAELLRWIATLEGQCSPCSPGSSIGQVNNAAGHDWVPIDPIVEELFSLCDRWHFLSRGTFDPTVVPLLRLWNRHLGAIPEEDEIMAVRSLVGWRRLQRKPGLAFLPEPGMAIDVCRIAKEYAVDHIMEMATHHGISSAFVEFGHAVRIRGEAPSSQTRWSIGLVDPKNHADYWAFIDGSNISVGTAGDCTCTCQANSEQPRTPIVDVRSGFPVSNGCRSATVVSPASCVLAGILSTSAFILGSEEGLALLEETPEAEGCILSIGAQHESRGFRRTLDPVDPRQKTA